MKNPVAVDQGVHAAGQKPYARAPVDFTTDQYLELINVAKLSYKFVGYAEISLSKRFVLWRHDIDYSVNRALKLAEIENKAGVKATYFINPHAEFYNFLERSQSQKIRHIILLGHDIGLHFDAAYYDVKSESQLDDLIVREADLLENWFGIRPVVFSFHNPTEYLLSCEQESYGGLINCYSQKFKKTIPYCSDSNGYWRFRRLRDVLEAATDPFLHVLTHPEWWQDKPLFPRERLLRCVHGRAQKSMDFYDAAMMLDGRENIAGPASCLNFLKVIDLKSYQICDYLWNTGHFDALYLELSRMHVRHVGSLCRRGLTSIWEITDFEINDVFAGELTAADADKLFYIVFKVDLVDIVNSTKPQYRNWLATVESLALSGYTLDEDQARLDCIYVCDIIQSAIRWEESRKAVAGDAVFLRDAVVSRDDSIAKIEAKFRKGWRAFKSSRRKGDK